MKQLQAGFARLDITPPMGAPMEGYYYARGAEGVLDPICVNAVAFRDEERSAVVLTVDLCHAPTALMQEWVGIIAEKASISPKAVLIHCTHSHTAPRINPKLDHDPQYNAWLLRRLCDAAVAALQDCRPVQQILAHEGCCLGITYPRRIKMKDGRYQTWGITGDPQIEGFAGPYDETMRLVRILREDADELVLVNFQSHPDNVSSTMISADFPGFLRSRVEQARAGTKCVYFNGAEGELIVHNYISDNNIPKYTRARWAGHVLAEYALAYMDLARPVEGDGVSYAASVLTSRTKRDPAKMPEALRIIHIHEHGNELEELGPDWVATPLVAEAYMRKRLEENQQDTVDIPLGAVAAGGLAFLGVAGEPFSMLGKQMRDGSPYPVTFVCCLTNGIEGYYSTAEAYDQDGYEPRSSRYPKGIGERITQAAIELLQSL